MNWRFWHALLYDPLTWLAERKVLAPLRRNLLEGVRGRVLELGTGTGANLPYYPADAKVVATDPDPYMLRRAVAKNGGRVARVSFVQCRAEDLPFSDGSFDVVLATLVLCTVDIPSLAVREARRVLRPDGELRLLEHVRAANWLGRLQDAIAPAWQRLSLGCRPNRRTGDILTEEGFDSRGLGTTALLVGSARPVAVPVEGEPVQ